MRTCKKSSTAIITTLALGLLPALPAAAQAAQEAPAAQTYSMKASQAVKAESGKPGVPMRFTVVKKLGADNEGVVITWVEDSEAKADPEGDPMHSTTVEYDVATARSKAVSIQ